MVNESGATDKMSTGLASGELILRMVGVGAGAASDVALEPSAAVTEDAGTEDAGADAAGAAAGVAGVVSTTAAGLTPWANLSRRLSVN